MPHRNTMAKFQLYSLSEANTAINEIKNKNISGAKVLKIS